MKICPKCGSDGYYESEELKACDACDYYELRVLTEAVQEMRELIADNMTLRERVTALETAVNAGVLALNAIKDHPDTRLHSDLRESLLTAVTLGELAANTV